MTRLCVAIFVTDIARAKRDIAIAAENGADLVELRIDALTDAHQVQDVVAASSLPCIVTCRPAWEGGQSELSNSDRAALLKAASGAGAAYVDLEWKATADHATAEDEPLNERTAADGSTRVIVSSHDFTGRPVGLPNIVLRLNSSPLADIVKIVWTARSIRDNLEAFEILQQKQKPTIALCMGEAGLISRVLARKFGAFLTFASLDASSGTASGQIPVADMKRLYRWDSITAGTKVYGVVAQPVMHSMSPAIHNAAFDHVGHDGVYLPFLVEGSYESFKAFLESFLHFPGMHLSGLSITIPHKQNALRYLQEKNAAIEELAVRIGAVNTIAIARDANDSPILRGFNTDYAAILDSITAKLGISRDKLANQDIAVIGAGGTGRTAVAALAAYGATITIYNRTIDRAKELATEFHGLNGATVRVAELNDLPASRHDIYVNTTSIGMHPNFADSPVGDTPPKFTQSTLVFDTVYNPIKTRLLRQAESAGAKIIGGVEMFVRQAASQFEAWTSQPAPTDVMRAVVEQRLSL